MTPIEQARALAAYWRVEAGDFGGCLEADEYVAKARETAEVLDKLVAELERP